jgi:4a-hydroxytetrahydrobiopterin dehydratase
MSDWITASQFHASEGVGDWRVVGEGAGACFRTGSFDVGVRFVQAIGRLAGVADHSPDIDLRHREVTVRLVTVAPDYYGMSRRDVEMARRISAVARDLGIPADPKAVQTVLVTIDALALPKVMPFWSAVLGYDVRADSPEDLVDPRGRAVSLWFQKMDASWGQQNRLHIDVWVPPEEAEARIAAAIAAGGRLVNDEHAPRWWTLADPEGNLADVATTRGRD